MRPLFVLSVAALSLAAVACGSSSSPPAPGPSTPQISVTGTVNGKTFAPKSVVASINQNDAGPGVLPETVFITEDSVDCTNFNDLQGRSVMMAITDQPGAVVGYSQAGALAEVQDHTASPPYVQQATEGSATVVQAATQSLYDVGDGGAGDRGHVKFDFTAGIDHVSGETDFVLCF